MISVVALLALGLLAPLPALAKTTVTSFPAAKLLLDKGKNTAPSVSVVGHGLLLVTNAISAGDHHAGTPTVGSNGVAGATRVLPACAAGTCNDSYRGAGAARLTVGDYAVWFELSLTQPPGRTGTAFGFSVEVAVETGAGWFDVTAYLSSGITTAAAGQTVDVNLLVDLGTTALPAVKVAESTLSGCASTAACP